MNASEERQIKSALDRLVEQTPEPGPTPDDMFLRHQEPTSRWAPLTAVAAATVAVVGLGILVTNRDPGPGTSAELPAQDTPTATEVSGSASASLPGATGDPEPTADRPEPEAAAQTLPAVQSPIGPDLPAAEPMLPYELFLLSPEDEHFLLKTFNERLDACLIDRERPPYGAETDSAREIAEHRAAVKKAAIDGETTIPERNIVGVTTMDPDHRACALDAYNSLETPSGRFVDEEPELASEANVEVLEKVWSQMSEHRKAWASCMVGLGYPGASMEVPVNEWDPPLPAGSVYETVRADDLECRATSGFDEATIELRTKATAEWARANADAISEVRAEMDELVKITRERETASSD